MDDKTLRAYNRDGGGAPKRIICENYNGGIAWTNSNYNNHTVWGGGGIYHKFTAAECGGTLPDASYVGVPYSIQGSCYVPNGATVYQPGDPMFPGFFSTFTACAGMVDMRVVYIQFDPSSPAPSQQFDLNGYITTYQLTPSAGWAVTRKICLSSCGVHRPFKTAKADRDPPRLCSFPS
jgi:hypothetical protein